MQMAVTCRTCLKTRSYTAAWMCRLHASSIRRCQGTINMDITDLHSADVEIYSGAGVYDGNNKSLSIKLKEFTDWLAVLSSIRVLLVCSCWFCRLGAVCLSVCLSVVRSVSWFVT